MSAGPRPEVRGGASDRGVARRARASALRATAVAAVLLLLASGSRGEDLVSAARPPSVAGRGDLDFEDVVAGVPSSVTRKDRHRAGSFWIRGTASAEVLLTLALPPSLSGPAGAALPITFGSDDAGFAWQQRPDLATGFNPLVPRIERLGVNGHGWVFLGGTVQPGMGQRAGAYSGTVVLTVAYIAQ